MSAISGISGTSNAWASVSNQRNQHQAKMFAKVDSDSSGGVDATELGKLFSKISEKSGVSLGDSAEAFGQMDSDGDGSLSSSELDEGMKSLMPPPPSTMEFAQSRGAGGGQEDDLFAKVDANGDGSLDADEVQALADKMKTDTGEDIGPDLAELDADGDGSLTQAEFEAGRPSGPGHAQGTQAAGGPPPAGGAGGPRGAGGAGGASASSATTYDPLDTNEDGTVSQMERLAGALKDLAQSDAGGGGSASSEIAKLAQKLYEQISGNSLTGSATTSQVSETA